MIGASGPGAPIVDREYVYSRASRRTLERRHDDFGLTDRWTYDSAYRIVGATYDQNGLPGATPRDLTSIAYVFDGANNRRKVDKATTSAGLTSADHAVNPVNEYSAVGGVPQAHDDNGNRTDDGRFILVFDALDRLVSVSDKATFAPVARYEYLPDGRRAKKVVYSKTQPGQVVEQTAFYWDAAQEVEEQDAATGAARTTFVWSPVYIDEIVQIERTSSHPLGAGTFYAHQDARKNVVALTNASGAVVEKVRYSDFGVPEIRGPGGEARSESAVGNVYMFQGRRYDPETGFYYFRLRYLDPGQGRFVSRDPLGIWGDPDQFGNAYSFAGNDPVNRVDPWGLEDDVIVWEEREPPSLWNMFTGTIKAAVRGKPKYTPGLRRNWPKRDHGNDSRHERNDGGSREALLTSGGVLPPSTAVDPNVTYAGDVEGPIPIDIGSPQQEAAGLAIAEAALKAALKEAGTEVQPPDDATGTDGFGAGGIATRPGGFVLLGPDSGKLRDVITDEKEEVKLGDVGQAAGKAALKALWKEYLYPIIKVTWFDGKLSFRSGWRFVKSRPVFSGVLAGLGLLGGAYYFYDLYEGERAFKIKARFDVGPLEGTCETDLNLRDPLESKYEFRLELKFDW